jgi:hypothetical protein
LTGNFRYERKKTGREFKIEFIRTIWPPRLIYLLPQEPSLLFIESTIGFQVDDRRGLAPTGSPRYLNGILPNRQFKKSEAITRKSFVTLTPTRQLFQKLTFNPEAISNPLKMALIAHKLRVFNLISLHDSN